MKIAAVLVLSFASTLAFTNVASAEEATIEHPNRHARYPIEVEPHFAFGFQNVYGNEGLGGGVRLSVPVIHNGFITSIDDNVAITFGADFLHYDNCYFADRCGADYLLLPVALQWSFFLSPHWSVFAEPGVYVYKGFLDRCVAGDPFCHEPSDFGVGPAISIGGRYMMSDSAALALRLGYPMTTFGVSFL